MSARYIKMLVGDELEIHRPHPLSDGFSSSEEMSMKKILPNDHIHVSGKTWIMSFGKIRISILSTHHIMQRNASSIISKEKAIS